MIYMLKSGEYIKIGYTQSLKSFPQRLEHYFTHNPNIEFIGYMEGSTKEENRFHKELSEFKINNETEEWFKVPIDVYNKLFNEFNPENKTYVIIGFDRKPKAVIKRKELEDCFDDAHNYAIKYFSENLKNFYSSEELKTLVTEINKTFNIHMNIRPCSVGLLVNIKKTTMRIPKSEGGGTKTMYKYVGKEPNYEYVRN